MEGAVYLLCAVTALVCGLLLLRGYFRTRTRLLLWCGACFLILCVENVMVFVDNIVYPEVRMLLLRRALALLAASALLFGLVWDTD